MMRIILILILLVSFNAIAADKKYGAGVMLGSFTAISGEYVLNKSSSYAMGLAFDIGDDRELHIHADRLFHKPDSLKLLGQVFSWYYGVGARYRTFDKDKSDDDYRIGARGSAGVVYGFKSIALKTFAESALTFNVLPATSADVDINIGLRYYF